MELSCFCSRHMLCGAANRDNLLKCVLDVYFLLGMCTFCVLVCLYFTLCVDFPTNWHERAAFKSVGVWAVDWQLATM